MAGSVKKIMAVAPAALVVRTGSPYPSASSSPARPAPARITPFYCPPFATAKGSSHRARSVGHGSCRGGLRLLSPASPPTHPMNFPLCIVVRCASTARFAARPAGKHNENYPTLPAALGGDHDRIFPAGRRLCRLGQVEHMDRFFLMAGVICNSRGVAQMHCPSRL